MKADLLLLVSICRTKRLQKGTAFALIIFILTMFLSCQTKVASDIPPDLLENKPIPTVDATDFETTYTDSGVVRYHLVTPRLLNFEKEKNPYMEFPEGFHLQEFDKDKKIISELSANYGKNFIADHKWVATGNVVMVNNKGDTLRTEELNYLQNDDLIYTDKFVSVKKGDQTLFGKGGFKSDSQMTKTTFFNTQGHVYMKDQ